MNHAKLNGSAGISKNAAFCSVALFYITDATAEAPPSSVTRGAQFHYFFHQNYLFLEAGFDHESLFEAATLIPIQLS